MRALPFDFRTVFAAGIAFLVAAGCSGDNVATQPAGDTSALYWSLALDHRAVTLATTSPYDTIRLTATPLNPAGKPLSGLGPVTYLSTDLARLRVSSDGVVLALAEGTDIAVVATLQAANVTHVDTAYIDVVADPSPRPLGSLSIHPVPPDSAKVGLRALGGKSLAVHARSVDSIPFPALRVDFRSSDPTIATVDRQTGQVDGRLAGHVLIVASSTAYGGSRVDTLSFTIERQIFASVSVDRAHGADASTVTTFTPSEITVGTGATITWNWTTDVPATDVTFDDPTNVGADTAFIGPIIGSTDPGNIPAQVGCTVENPLAIFQCLRSRTFPVPGIYRYHSALTGASGEITVVDESAASNP